MNNFGRAFLVLALVGFLFLSEARGSTVIGWGADESWQIDIPLDLTNAVAITAGLNCSLALNADGTVTNWGATYSGPPEPTDLTNIVCISGRAAHNVVLRNDGTVAAWGEGFPKSYVPDGISNGVVVATGFEASLVLKNDTTVFGWGGMTGSYSTGYWGADDGGAHIVPPGLTNVMAIAGGGYFTLALKGDGTVTGWGDDFWGETDVPSDLTNAVAIAAGGYHGVALKSDGTVLVWGDNSGGQLNMPPDVTNVVAIAAGWYHTLALKADGTVISWGYNFAGQTDVPTNLSNVVAIAAGYTHNVVIVSTNDAPVVFQSPLDQTVVAGDSALLMANAFGSWPLTQQWQFNGTNLDGKTIPALFLTNVHPSQAGIYFMTATNSLGGAQSSNAVLTVLPFVLTSPTNQTRYVGDDVSVTVGLRGVGPFAFQWQFNGTNLPDATNAVLFLPHANTNATGIYSVTVSNIYGTIQSSNAAIAVLDSAPFPVIGPAGVITWTGTTISFQIVANGTKPIYYQWQTNNVPLPGATNATLTLAGVVSSQAGAYSVTVSNAVGKFTTANVNLTLVPVAAWGGTNGNATNLPAALTNAIAVAAGGYSHGLALKPNGTVVSWGLLTSVPSNVTNVAAIAAASYQSLALRSNGTVVAWNTIITVPTNASNVAAIAVGGYSSGLGCFVVKSNGTVQAWGLGTTGLTNVPAGLNGVIDLAAGKFHALALRGDGSIKEWADGADGNGKLNSVPTNVTDVIAVSARAQHSIALKADGTVAAWGNNPYGETNVPDGLSNVVAVAAAEDNSIALKQDGRVVIWGRNNFGQTNIAPGVSNVVGISGGLDYNLFELGGTNLTVVRQPRSVVGLPRQQVLLSVGAVSQNSFTAQWQFNGTNIAAATNLVQRIPSLAKADQGNYRVLLASGSLTVTSAVAQVTMNGNSVVAWGTNSFGQTNVPPGMNAVAAGGGIGDSLVIRTDGGVTAWGINYFNVTNPPTTATNVIAVAAGTHHNLALRGDGKVIAWGDGSFGKTSVPSSLTNAIAIAAGDTFSLAINVSGGIAQWGSLASTPANLSNVVSVAAGYSHALALKSDGHVVTWGTNAAAVPMDLSNVISIAAGNNFSLALATNGIVTAWGTNNYGQTTVPANVSNVVAIAAGGYTGLALKSDGTFATWGRNFANLTNPPAGLSNVVFIAGGDLHSLAVIGSSDGPTIVRQPTPVCFANVFDRALLSVGAVSANAMNYQWRLNGTNLPGATNAIFCLPVANTNDSGNYSVVITNTSGSSAVSSNALLTVVTHPPVIVAQPVGQTNFGGATAVFQIAADGAAPLVYQWRKNNLAITDATNNLLTLVGLRRTNEGAYTVVVANQFGVLASSNANLRVLVPQLLRLATLNPDGSLAFAFSDSDGGTLSSNDAVHFLLQSSADLVNWQTLSGALTSTNGLLQYHDTNAANYPQQFYRVIEQP